MIPAAFILLFVAVIFIAAWTAGRIGRGKYIDHSDKRQRETEWVIKTASGIPAIILFSIHQDWIQIVFAPFMTSALYWLLFDSILGLMLHKGIFYTGTDWAGRAKTAKLPMVVKVAAVIGLTAAYFLL